MNAIEDTVDAYITQATRADRAAAIKFLSHKKHSHILAEVQQNSPAWRCVCGCSGAWKCVVGVTPV